MQAKTLYGVFDNNGILQEVSHCKMRLQRAYPSASVEKVVRTRGAFMRQRPHRVHI